MSWTRSRPDAVTSKVAELYQLYHFRFELFLTPTRHRADGVIGLMATAVNDIDVYSSRLL